MDKPLNPLYGMTPEEMGCAVSIACTWNGNAIFEAFTAALTDANFHTAAAALANTWKQTEGA